MTSYHPMQPDVLDNPALSHRFLLEEAPVYLVQDFEPEFYVLSRHEDVSGALRDISTFSSEFGQGPQWTPPRGMLSDPPNHTYFRSLVQEAFKPAAIAALEGWMTTVAERLATQIGEQPSWDVHEDFAFPLPVTVIAEMLGVPESDRNHFKRWSDASVAAMGAQDPSSFSADLAELQSYLIDAVERVRGEPNADNLIATLIRARKEGQALTNEDIVHVLNQLLVGGNETTTSLITNLVWRLLEQPELWRHLQQHPEDLQGAIEESLRFDPPVLALYRNTTRDVTLHGVTIPARSKVMMYYAAANRDPRVFENPDEFRIGRKGRNLSLGLGVHFCLGAQLARLETTVALKTLLQHFPDLQLENSGTRIAPFFLWGRHRLPVSTPTLVNRHHNAQ